MGKIKKGILGGFSGKVGTVVGSNWKGISYMRSLPQKVRNPRTEPQVNQRSKFTQAIHFLKPMTALLRIGWKQCAHKRSPFNAAMSYTIANAITGNYPNYSIDASKVLISCGTLAPVANASTSVVTSGTILVEWDDNSGSSNAKQNDKALLAVVNPAKYEAVFDTASATRSTGSQSIALPGNWFGQDVKIYIGFISEDGKEVANSLYVGSISIV